MSFSTLKPVAALIAPSTGPDGSHSRLSTLVRLPHTQPLPSLQVKEKENPLTETNTHASRREMMHLTAASIGLLPLLLPASAEARPRNATMRQKIMEKLEDLRQKMGLAKPKDQGEAKKPNDEAKDMKPNLKEEAKEYQPKPNNKGEEKILPEPVPVPELEPALPNTLNGSTELRPRNATMRQKIKEKLQ